ncbi:hypothetical protein JTB14_036544 [Gonioctena quinquepunctata]|nr:hypothetical protein JTB14_036544 [Gonioctena quinquepunctata]
MESVASNRRANGALFFGATNALISWDPPSSAVDPSTKGPQDQPMETAVSVEDESTSAEGVERQPTPETHHTAERASETEDLDPEDVTLTLLHRDLVAVKIKVVDDTKGNTRDVIVGSAYFSYETKDPPREVILREKITCIRNAAQHMFNVNPDINTGKIIVSRRHWMQPTTELAQIINKCFQNYPSENTLLINVLMKNKEQE